MGPSKTVSEITAEDLLGKIALLEEANALQAEEIRLLRAIIFGRKSEKRNHPEDSSTQQLLLFEDSEKKPKEVSGEAERIKVQTHTRKKSGRRPLPAHLPRVEIIHDLPEEKKNCSCCGNRMEKIGEEVSEKVDIVPPKIQVQRDIRLKYACKQPECGGMDDPEGAVKTAPVPPQIIPQGIVTVGMLVYVIISRFADSLPFYRQVTQLQRLGLDITRGTLSNWAILTAEACKEFFVLLMQEALNTNVVQMDETRTQVLKEPGRANTTTSYMWVMRGGPPKKPVVIFRYYPTKESKIPKELLRDYSGYLQTDGYAGYELIGKREGIRHVGCWAHARRKFVEVLKGTKGTLKGSIAQQALDNIGKLYEIEREARDRDLDPGEIEKLRNKRAKPILDEFKVFLEKYRKTSPERSLLGRAIHYAWNIWPHLVAYLENGTVPIDNNGAENAIRPFVIGRKNSLFSGSPRGAEATAIFYSIIETAKANGLDPFRYLKFLFTEIPKAASQGDLKALLPQYLDRSRLPTS